MASIGLDPAWCAVRELPGRGFGVVATTTLRCGVTACRAPALLASCAATTEEVVRSIIADVPVDSADTAGLLRRLWACCPQHATGPMLERLAPRMEALEQLLCSQPPARAEALGRVGIRTPSDVALLAVKLNQNGFAEGVFPHASFFNHSCLPNCNFEVSTARDHLLVITCEEIAEGDELTISYLPEACWHLPTDQRRSLLLPRYGFQCWCQRCDKRLRSPAVRAAERALEGMRCALCGSGGLVLPVDEHEDPSGERQEGYRPCSKCALEADSQVLDAATTEVYSVVRSGAEQTRTALDSPDASLAEQEVLSNLLVGAARHLAPSHWLMYEIHERMQVTSSTIACAALDRGDADTYREMLAYFATHSVLLVRCAESIFPPKSNLLTILRGREEDARRLASDAGIENAAEGHQPDYRLASAAAGSGDASF